MVSTAHRMILNHDERITAQRCLDDTFEGQDCTVFCRSDDQLTSKRQTLPPIIVPARSRYLPARRSRLLHLKKEQLEHLNVLDLFPILLSLVHDGSPSSAHAPFPLPIIPELLLFHKS